MKNTIQDKTKLVNSVFSKVHKRYDIMNDIMSFGIHRIWKNKLVDWMNPRKKDKLIDVASGTGDIAKLFSKRNNNLCEVSCVEPNPEMYIVGKKNLHNFSNIKWFKANAESLPFNKDEFDFYTISFGLRNVSDINLTLQEAFRVLKPGGRFMCLEFSKIQNDLVHALYNQYSKAIPAIGKYIVGSSAPYKYLVESIKQFHSQEELAKLMEKNGFSKVEYRNLSNGISAIHTGWKI